MYLSRVEINTQDRQKLRDLSHLGAFHNWVEQSFPDELNQKPRTRKLWRIDKLNGKYYLLVVSQSKPDLKLLERYGVSESASTSLMMLLNAIKEGMKVRFRVTLNPADFHKDRNKYSWTNKAACDS